MIPLYLFIFFKAFIVSSSCPGLIKSGLVDGSNFKIKFFKFFAAEAPAALIKNSLSSLTFPSTIKIFKLLTQIIHLSYCADTLVSYLLQTIFLGFLQLRDLLRPFLTIYQDQNLFHLLPLIIYEVFQVFFLNLKSN